MAPGAVTNHNLNGLPSLIVLCGCMFAGKTTRLMQRLQQLERAGHRVLVIKHALDNRYDPDQLATHDGRRMPATAINDAVEIIDLVHQREAVVVGVDEAQFFGGPLLNVWQTLHAAGVSLVAAGIDYDSWGRPFPPLPLMMPLATEVEVLTRPCVGCGLPARYTERVTPVTDGMVGGIADYQPKCRACFVPLASPPPVYH